MLRIMAFISKGSITAADLNRRANSDESGELCVAG